MISPPSPVLSGEGLGVMGCGVQAGGPPPPPHPPPRRGGGGVNN
jgi:hypothetical protein